MLLDGEPIERTWQILRKGSSSTKAVLSLVRFFEQRLGARMLYNVSRLPSKNLGLLDLYDLAERMQEKGILRSWGRVPNLPDEPPLHLWFARFEEGDDRRAAGSSTHDEHHALTCTLAEALERYIWLKEIDYFRGLTEGTVAEIAAKGRCTPPESFAGLSEKQQEHRGVRITPDRRYLWTKAESLTGGDDVWVPAQAVSPTLAAQRLVHEGREPRLRRIITTGLATHPVRELALLGGGLEIIERDAYMVTWLNQLTMPRVDLDELASRSPSLKDMVDRCLKYRLRPHIVRLLTDAPSYVFCAVLEDMTNLSPRLAFGLKAHRDPVVCAEKAIMEALRARRAARIASLKGTEVPQHPEEIGHYDRILYWAQGDRYKKLEFFYAGPIQHFTEPWEHDTASQHLERVIAWCKERGYEFATVPLTHSKNNAAGWHIEMTLIPQLQPTHLSERFPYLGGKRLSEVPTQFGYTPRPIPFMEEPHPFA